MCIERESRNSKMLNSTKLSCALHAMLTQAKINRRLVCGPLPAISKLEQSPEEVLFCLLPQIVGDAAIHMQTVLLQAYCYENYIPVIQVDSSEKLAYYCGEYCLPNRTGCTCVIVTRDLSLPSTPEDEFPMSPTEKMLTDFYDFTVEKSPMPVIELPS